MQTLYLKCNLVKYWKVFKIEIVDHAVL